jgi:hypothetical protein
MTSKREKAKWKTIDSFFTKPVSTETKDSSDKIASTEEPISKESLPERIDDSEHASSVSTVPRRARYIKSARFQIADNRC